MGSVSFLIVDGVIMNIEMSLEIRHRVLLLSLDIGRGTGVVAIHYLWLYAEGVCSWM